MAMTTKPNPSTIIVLNSAIALALLGSIWIWPSKLTKNHNLDTIYRPE